MAHVAHMVPHGSLERQHGRIWASGTYGLSATPGGERELKVVWLIWLYGLSGCVRGVPRSLWHMADILAGQTYGTYGWSHVAEPGEKVTWLSGMAYLVWLNLPTCCIHGTPLQFPSPTFVFGPPEAKCFRPHPTAHVLFTP